MQHRAVDKRDEQYPTISVDYGFLGTPECVATDLPILVVRDRWSKSVWSHLVPSKGVENPHGSKCLLGDLRETGYQRVVLKSDQECRSELCAPVFRFRFPGKLCQS